MAPTVVAGGILPAEDRGKQNEGTMGTLSIAG